jgi:hypothetical protein
MTGAKRAPADLLYAPIPFLRAPMGDRGPMNAFVRAPIPFLRAPMGGLAR